MSENPYQSPELYEERGRQHRASLLRGLVWAVALGCAGFCIPFAVLPFFGFEARELWSNASVSATVLSAIFASSAFANFTPARGIGFVRSLLVSLCLFFLTAIVWGLVVTIVDPGAINHRRGDPPPPLTIYHIVFYMILLAEGVAFAHWQGRRAERKMEM